MNLNKQNSFVLGKKVIILALLISGVNANDPETIAVEKCKVKLTKIDKSVDLVDVSVDGNIYRTKWETDKFRINCNIKDSKLINISKEKR